MHILIEQRVRWWNRENKSSLCGEVHCCILPSEVVSSSCFLRFGFIFYYDNMLADLNPYFMLGHLVPWQRAAGANEDAAGSSSCAAQFTHMPLMLPSTPSPGTLLPAREEQQERETHAEPADLPNIYKYRSTNTDFVIYMGTYHTDFM